jgi:hypothetical protein
MSSVVQLTSEDFALARVNISAVQTPVFHLRLRPNYSSELRLRCHRKFGPPENLAPPGQIS